jgi:hypothetical protein
VWMLGSRDEHPACWWVRVSSRGGRATAGRKDRNRIDALRLASPAVPPLGCTSLIAALVPSARV